MAPQALSATAINGLLSQEPSARQTLESNLCLIETASPLTVTTPNLEEDLVHRFLSDQTRKRVALQFDSK